MSHPRQDHEDIAHDVLAAEEFALGSADPELHRRHEQAERGQAHDVLAAEEFALGSADRGLRHEPLVLPADPYGAGDPHDVLAAEEFALPGPPVGSRVPPGTSALPTRPWLLGAAGLLAITLLRRRRR